MSYSRHPGSTAFDRLRAHYAASRETCPACGHEDVAGGWDVSTAGRRVEYRHRCRSCGAVDTRELRL